MRHLLEFRHGVRDGFLVEGSVVHVRLETRQGFLVGIQNSHVGIDVSELREQRLYVVQRAAVLVERLLDLVLLSEIRLRLEI